MRTIVYIDGFNFYYGCLKDTPYRWLDLKAMCESILKDYHKIVEIKYFAAVIRGTESNPNARKRQKAYFDALEAHIPEITIRDDGYFSWNTKYLRSLNPPPNRVGVYVPEEKGTDVNLATNMVADAFLDRYDCAVLISNDRDMAEAMSLIKEHHPKKHLCLFTPSFAEQRKTSPLLSTHADFIMKINNRKLLSDCQLPDVVLGPDGNDIIKPRSWH